MQLLYAVLTGDLIGSSKAPRARLETTMENIAATAQFFTEFTGEDTRFTRYRGDGWQMILSPAFYLRAVTMILARLKADPQALPTRIGLGIGTIESPGTTDLSDAKGPAFEHSGRALDSLTRDRTLALRGDLAEASEQDAKVAKLSGAIQWSDAALLPLIGFIAHRWSAPQAEAIALALQNENQKQAAIADSLGITRQALNLRLTGAGYGPILEALKLSELHFQDTTDEGSQTA
jgi:hypothetical protein